MRISDWSSDVCSSDLVLVVMFGTIFQRLPHCPTHPFLLLRAAPAPQASIASSSSRAAFSWMKAKRCAGLLPIRRSRSEEHTSELQSLMRISYAVFCLKKKKTTRQNDANSKYMKI